MGVTARRYRRALAVVALPGLVVVVADRTQAAPPDEPVEPAPVEPTPNAEPTPAAAPVEASANGSYVVVMAADPVISYDGDIPGLAATAVGEASDLDTAAPAVEEYVAYVEGTQDAALAAAGVDAGAQGDTFAYALNGFEAELTVEEANALAQVETVAKVVPNVLQELQTDNTPDFLGLTARRGAYAAGWTGEDVIVGVIDSGIWPEHASFADDGSYAELEGTEDLPCEFGNTAHNAADVPFECNDKLLGAYDMRDAYVRFQTPPGRPFPEIYLSARDYDGHGTHTASTAAGNADVEASIYGIDRGTVQGIAPRARVIAYSACGDLGCYTSDLVQSIDQAVVDGVDVINYSIGGGAGPVGPDELSFLFAADANVWVANSAGNSGPLGSTVGSPSVVPWVTSVAASTHDRTFANAARLGNGTLITGASITAGTPSLPLVDAADLGNELCYSDRPFSADITGTIVLCLRGANARVDKSKAVFDNGGAGMILYNPNDVQALVTDTHWVPSIHVNLTSGLAVKAYIDAAGAAARASLSAGQAIGAQGSVMADFSSRGPNPIAADIIRPDVTAPGVNVLAGHTPTPSVGNGAPGQLFQSISGTSMSSPHVAGLYALLRQAHPDWSAAAAKSAIMTTARQDVVKEDGATPADPFDMGAGHIDPSGNPARAGSPFTPGLVYDAGLFEYFGFLCDADTAVFADPATTCAALEAGGIPTTAANLNLASIGVAEVVGSTTVQRTVTNVTGQRRVWRATAEADGFDVTVEPSQLRLGAGESATFTVTISNTGAPDEWRFGALTWSSGGYEVRSPIAAKGAVFAAPAAVEGEGTEGSVEVPVQFGYTGPYSPAPHGPAANEAIVGTVEQDPDATFAPADPAGTLAVPIELSDSAFWRLQLGPEDLAASADPDTDIDLFLYKDGVRVAESTSGGTNELIELVLPEDGSYVLYVHGWAVPGGAVDVAVGNWSVPLTPGTGSLTIESAPESAVIGETGVVVAGWSGLAPDAEYVGAVSHAGPDGLLGLTLVEIDT